MFIAVFQRSHIPKTDKKAKDNSVDQNIQCKRLGERYGEYWESDSNHWDETWYPIAESKDGELGEDHTQIDT